MYQVQMQFIPGNDQIWVAQLNPGDPIYEYNNEPEAAAKAAELEAADETGRKYRVHAPAEEIPTEEPIV
jgi:ribosomal protein L16/L10AE